MKHIWIYISILLALLLAVLFFGQYSFLSKTTDVIDVPLPDIAIQDEVVSLIDPRNCIVIDTQVTDTNEYTLVYIGKSQNNEPETMPDYCNSLGNESLQRMIYSPSEDGRVFVDYSGTYSNMYAAPMHTMEVRSFAEFDYIYTESQLTGHYFQDPYVYTLKNVSGQFNNRFDLQVTTANMSAPNQITLKQHVKVYTLLPIHDAPCTKDGKVSVTSLQVESSESKSVFILQEPFEIACESFPDITNLFEGNDMYSVGAPDIRIEDPATVTLVYDTKEITVQFTPENITFTE